MKSLVILILCHWTLRGTIVSGSPLSTKPSKFSLKSFASGLTAAITNRQHLSEAALLQAPPGSLTYCDEPVCYKTGDPESDLGCFEPWPLTVYGTINLYKLCPQEPTSIAPYLFAFYSQNPDSPSTSLDEIHSNDRIVFFVPGYKNIYNESYLTVLKDELLQSSVVDVVIMVDYAAAADPGIISRVTDLYNFHQAAANTQVVGRQLAIKLKQLEEKKNIDFEKVHFICFSLGTQVAHFMASYALSKLSFQVGRITALDPPGILIFSPEKRLNPSDAKFVDVIHTTSFHAPWDFNSAGSGKVGLSDPLGHVDFYPNGGGLDDADQPGCSGKEWCSHAFSLALMRASIRRCHFQAVACHSSDLFSSGRCEREARDTRLGYWAVKYPGRGRYFLVTSEDPLQKC